MFDSPVEVIYSLIVTFFLAAVVWFSSLGQFIPVFLSCMAAWLSFLRLHRIVTGDLVHTGEEEIEFSMPEDTGGKLLFVLGLLIMASAYPAGIVGVNREFFSLVWVSQLLFFGGYFVIHISWGDGIV